MLSCITCNVFEQVVFLSVKLMDISKRVKADIVVYISPFFIQLILRVKKIAKYFILFSHGTSPVLEFFDYMGKTCHLIGMAVLSPGLVNVLKLTGYYLARQKYVIFVRLYNESNNNVFLQFLGVIIFVFIMQVTIGIVAFIYREQVREIVYLLACN